MILTEASSLLLLNPGLTVNRSQKKRGLFRRPRTFHHRPGRQFGGIHHHVFDQLPVPGVGDVKQPVAGLDNRRVGVFGVGIRVILKQEGSFPLFSVAGKGQVQNVTVAPFFGWLTWL